MAKVLDRHPVPRVPGGSHASGTSAEGAPTAPLSQHRVAAAHPATAGNRLRTSLCPDSDQRPLRPRPLADARDRPRPPPSAGLPALSTAPPTTAARRAGPGRARDGASNDCWTPPAREIARAQKVTSPGIDPTTPRSSTWDPNHCAIEPIISMKFYSAPRAPRCPQPRRQRPPPHRTEPPTTPNTAPPRTPPGTTAAPNARWHEPSSQPNTPQHTQSPHGSRTRPPATPRPSHRRPPRPAPKRPKPSDRQRPAPKRPPTPNAHARWPRPPARGRRPPQRLPTTRRPLRAGPRPNPHPQRPHQRTHRPTPQTNTPQRPAAARTPPDAAPNPTNTAAA